MDKRKKVASSTTNLPNYESKDTNSSRNIRLSENYFYQARSLQPDGLMNWWL